MKAYQLKFETKNNKLTQQIVNWDSLNGYLFKGHSDFDDYAVQITSICSVVYTGYCYLIFALNKKDIYRFKIKLIRHVMNVTRKNLLECLKRENKLHTTENKLYDLLPPSLK